MSLVIVTTPGIISNGFAKSIERPGGSATGIEELPPGVTATRLECIAGVTDHYPITRPIRIGRVWFAWHKCQ